MGLLLVLLGSLPGDSFMKVNSDMMKALRGGYTCCISGRYSNTKRDKELSFHKCPRDVSLREKWINSIQKKGFIPGEQHRVCSQHFHATVSVTMAPAACQERNLVLIFKRIIDWNIEHFTPTVTDMP